MALRADKKGFSLIGFDKQHYLKTENYVQAIETLYNKAIMELSQLAVGLKVDPKKPFSFADFPATKAASKDILNSLASNMQAVMIKGNREQWLFACKKNDAFLASIMDTSKVPKKSLAKYQDKNLDALNAFQNRKVDGLDMSQRIWKYTGQFKEQMELGIDVALGEGQSAQQLSKVLRQHLIEPNNLFRRVRDKHGNLKLSKRAAAFHPGQGVYRSSYKNAMRFTRSEINMAYRESDHNRWQNLDFVVGKEIKISNNHPVTDICDTLQGKYPKEFKWVAWHPQCRCQAFPILMDRDEIRAGRLNRLRSALYDTEYQKYESRNAVTSVPEGFTNWISENADKIKGWKSQPYFIKDNFTGGTIEGGLKMVIPKVGSNPVLSTLETAKNGGSISIYSTVNKNGNDYNAVISCCREFALKGKQTVILPQINIKDPAYKTIYGDLIGTQYEGKCPDFSVDGIFYEHEGFTTQNPKANLSNMLRRGLKQSARIIIEDCGVTENYLMKNIYARISEGSKIEEVLILNKDGSLTRLYKSTEAKQ